MWQNQKNTVLCWQRNIDEIPSMQNRLKYFDTTQEKPSYT